MLKILPPFRREACTCGKNVRFCEMLKTGCFLLKKFMNKL